MGVQIRPIFEGFFFSPFISFGVSTLFFPLLLLFVKGSVTGKAQSVMGSASPWRAKGLFLVTQSFGGRYRMWLPTFPVPVWVRCPQGERWWRKLGVCSVLRGESLFSMTSQRCSHSLGTARAAALWGQPQTDV